MAFAQDLSTDPYVPLVGSLLAHATRHQASEWLQRQQGRLVDGTGFSLAIADAATNVAVGQIGLWLAHLPHGRAEAGYAVAPSARRGIRTPDRRNPMAVHAQQQVPVGQTLSLSVGRGAVFHKTSRPAFESCPGMVARSHWSWRSGRTMRQQAGLRLAEASEVSEGYCGDIIT